MKRISMLAAGTLVCETGKDPRGKAYRLRRGDAAAIATFPKSLK